jgi:hypothetical protein
VAIGMCELIKCLIWDVVVLVAIGMCELINCLKWEVLVLCCYWNVRIDKLSYKGSAGIVTETG